MNEFWNQAWLIFVGLLPFLGFLGVCFVIVRAIFNADRNERKAQARWQAEQNEARRRAQEFEDENAGPTTTD